MKLELDHRALSRLDEASRIDLGFPHEFLAGGAREYVYGETFEKTRPHR